MSPTRPRLTLPPAGSPLRGADWLPPAVHLCDPVTPAGGRRPSPQGVYRGNQTARTNSDNGRTLGRVEVALATVRHGGTEPGGRGTSNGPS